MSNNSNDAPFNEGNPNFFNVAPAQPFVTAAINAQQPSLLGSMPAETVANILERLNQQSLGAFILSARWCQAHAGDLFYKNVHASTASMTYLTTNPQHLPKIRHLDIDCRTVQPQGQQILAFIPTLPNLRSIRLHGVSGRATARILFLILGFMPAVQTLGRLEVSIGQMSVVSGMPRLRGVGASDPEWDDLNMTRQPNLQELVFDFGPTSTTIMRLDTFVYSVTVPNRDKLRILEVKCIEEKDAQILGNGLKHYIFRCAEEEVNPQASTEQDIMEGVEAFQSGYISMFATPSLEIFRFYSEVQAVGSTEREINIQEVCHIWPNLKEIDFVTRASWSSDLRNMRLEPPMTTLKNFNFTGVTRTNAPASNPAGRLTDSDLVPRGPFATQGVTAMQDLTRNCFPNVLTYGWYHRNSDSTINVSPAPQSYVYRIKVIIRKDIWHVIRDNTSMFNPIPVFRMGAALLSHWWGRGESIYRV
ncbi:hypothetical protein TWF281_004770 [Arthrobotrys megalospora]